MATTTGQVRRFGRSIGLRPESEQEYIRYHADVWPGVLKIIEDCNIHNYSIFISDHTLFAYFEYAGQDFEADMARMAADPKTQEWWSLMEPMQEPLPSRKPGDWWTEMEAVFHVD